MEGKGGGGTEATTRGKSVYPVLLDEKMDRS